MKLIKAQIGRPRANRKPRALLVAIIILPLGFLVCPQRSFADGAPESEVGGRSCAAVAGADLQVTQDIAPVKVSADYGLATIVALARRVRPVVGPPPEGFYLGTFTYSIHVETIAEPVGCTARSDIHVVFHLARRIIELGRELKTKPCAWSAELQRYQHHAKADETVLARYATLVRHDLESNPLPAAHSAAWVHARIEGDIVSLGASRRAAQEAVNTQDELARRNGACSVEAPIRDPSGARAHRYRAHLRIIHEDAA